uniref:J domain-containing protein n=1 Tax=Mucochytrium quahogii TaxID=96639 RepID=A0A7S2W519_9STRA|mmetsp:Transcript_13427/g.28856  ORF Transcript_13427/g.28856 Transcript_13427/m.28856 type:complete len:522 (+) Transcript_13427:345-1910(+)
MIVKSATRLALCVLFTLKGGTTAFFGFGGSDGDEKPVKSDPFGCIRWAGVAGCNAESEKLDEDPDAKKSCRSVIKSTQSGFCKCSWGEESRVDCGHKPFTCEEVCSESFPGGETDQDSEWLKGTTWNWNNWRNVRFLGNGIFDAPTEDCAGGDCFWTAKGNTVFILWGDSGMHTTVIDSSKKSMKGIRHDGDPCSAVFVRKENNDDEDNKDEDEDLFELLGLEYDATEQDIKKSFRKLSRDYHPDRVRSSGECPIKAEKMFDRIRNAYEILGDPDTRILYETGGMEAVKKFIESGGREGEEQRGRDPFAMMFGGGRNSNRGRDFEFSLKVSLEDMYNGGEVRTKVNRRVVCRGCRKITTKNKEKCSKCGKCPPETRTVHRQMGGFMVQQQEQVPSKERCKEEPAELVVTVEKGMDTGARIVFPRMSEQKPGQIPGDIILELDTNPHPQFIRDGDNLKTTMHLSLKEALTGFEHSFKHLDGHLVEIETDPETSSNDIIRPFQKRTLKGKGMPVHNFPWLLIK